MTQSKNINGKPLTAQQTEFLTRLAAGETYKEIWDSKHYYISKVLKEARARIGVRTNFQLMAEAVKRGLIK